MAIDRPVCAQLLIALTLSLLGRTAGGNGVSATMALIGLVLVICCCDWLWVLRHDVDLVTGFYIVGAACVLLLGFAVASLRSHVTQEGVGPTTIASCTSGRP
jgi:predicted acyltransferase